MLIPASNEYSKNYIVVKAISTVFASHISGAFTSRRSMSDKKGHGMV